MPLDTRIPEHGVRQLRKGRASISGQVYHVTAITRERQPVFEDLFLGRIIVSCLKYESEAGRATTLCYVVMPDHLHWLLELTGKSSLSRVVHNVKSQSARQINAVSGHVAAVWQRGFYDRAIRRDEDLPLVARYLVANPQRAGIVKSCREYPLWDAVWL
jgi:REP element-mobilizing transposase RayT